ncbi:prolyl oligopeptidase family serine peptidase [Variovorax sp. J22P168]|uniref:alpha/beta hydrolase family protein n=1 Tax=Variovorax jilinensis TaxID=3053513 RepID=UPI002575440A|nr:prolyl oligopeptidase family serine peptidase [Variovorax sp. J22P168]MDM0014075.1 prolyl oligopeptidase family serine peptidase [Variovorax sp. J22P168]
MNKLPAFALAGTALLLSACGGGGGGSSFNLPVTADTGRGSVVTIPPERIQRITASEFSTLLQANSQGKALRQVAGDPKCGVDVRYLEYRTVGGQNEATTATAAIMVPSGTDAACNGPRPVVLYAHGTNAARDYNIARWTDPNQPASAEGVIVAAMFAAQGYIVVAPNYAGYDKSPLPYHPYLNGTQQGKDAVDALTAARRTFPLIETQDAGSLFVTGYSQGGYVALAAHRELQATSQTVTASAPLSAPGAISLLADYSFSGWPALGATLFTPMLSTSWQKQFGNVYTATGDIYEAQYATGIDTLLPTTLTPTTALYTTGKLPPLALYPPNAVPGPVSPSLALFYAPNNLVRQSYLTQAFNDIQANPCPGNALPVSAASLSTTSPLGCQPLLGFRKAAVANDQRSWLPTRPMLMCGGANDPTVNFASTRATSGYYRARGMPASALTVVDLEDVAATDAYSTARAGFAQAKINTANAAGTDPTQQAQAVVQAYHGTLVPPFCMAAARGFFAGVLAAGG